MPATQITITDALARFALGPTVPPDWTAGTVEAFSCQVTTAQINATPNLVEVPATWCQGATQTAAASSFELALSGLQDWTVADGLSMFLWENDTREGWVQLSIPTSETGDPIAVAVCHVRFVAGSFGGAAGSPLTFDATFPCQEKPTITPGTAALLASRAADAELVET